MQKGTDSRIQARVRILLARRWIDLSSITVGTTNGVVYIGGSLRTTGRPEAASETRADGPGDRWLSRIRREISSIPEVRDVVFQLHDRGEAGWQEHSA